MEVLQGDALCRSLVFLGWKEVVEKRRVASCWKDAASCSGLEEEVNAETQRRLKGISDCIPGLHSLCIDHGYREEGEEGEKLPSSWSLLLRFHHLRHLKCMYNSKLLEPLEFSSVMKKQWQHLQSLNFHDNESLHWRLSDLASLEHLQDLRCINNRCLTGDIQDMFGSTASSGDEVSTKLFRTLTILDISGCIQVTGSLRDFAELPKLQWLGIARTQIVGDLRYDIVPNQFVSLQGIGMDSEKVYGAAHIMSVSDAPAVMRARHQILKQSNWESPVYPLLVHMSKDSPEYHERAQQRLYSSERDPPFSLEPVLVGKRRGWRWSNLLGGYCETHWMDPEPLEEKDRLEYEAEVTEFLDGESLFKGFWEPPTPEQYFTICTERIK